MESLPAKFTERIQNQFPGYWQNLIDALNSEPPVSIRINKNKLSQIPTKYKQVPWSSSGIYLPERPLFTLDPLFHAGIYYPQEAGSMVIEYIAQILSEKFEQPPKYILDAASAPGGKTLILSDIFAKSIIFANEIISKRANILTDNIAKWGAENVVVTNNDTAHFQHLKGVFDIVLLDAPCSGEGMFRKDINARNEWSVENAVLCAARQSDILQNILPLIKENGYLIYSTCTFNPDENEKLMQKVLPDAGFEFVPFDELQEFGIEKVENGFGYQFLPGKVESEGFFLSIWKNTNPNRQKENKKKVKKDINLSVKLNFPLQKDKKTYLLNEEIYAIPKDLDASLLKNLNIKYAGVKLGKLIKNKFKPAAESVFSNSFKNQFPTIELTYINALQYLKGNTNFPLPEKKTKGYYTVTYKNHPLGLIHSLGNRFNNLYPKPWRIKMHIPENQKENFLF